MSSSHWSPAYHHIGQASQVNSLIAQHIYDAQGHKQLTLSTFFSLIARSKLTKHSVIPRPRFPAHATLASGPNTQMVDWSGLPRIQRQLHGCRKDPTRQRPVGLRKKKLQQNGGKFGQPSVTLSSSKRGKTHPLRITPISSRPVPPKSLTPMLPRSVAQAVQPNLEAWFLCWPQSFREFGSFHQSFGAGNQNSGASMSLLRTPSKW